MTSNNKIEIYQSKDGQTQVEVTFEKETVWLSQEQLGQLFERDRTVIGRHIRNIFNEGELDEEVVCANFAHTTQHGAISVKTQTSLGNQIISNEALASLTLFAAASKPEEMKTVKKLIVSVLNRNK